MRKFGFVLALVFLVFCFATTAFGDWITGSVEQIVQFRGDCQIDIRVSSAQSSNLANKRLRIQLPEEDRNMFLALAMLAKTQNSDVWLDVSYFPGVDYNNPTVAVGVLNVLAAY